MKVEIRACQSGRTTEAVPSPALDLDIVALEPKLEARGWQPIVNAGVLLIARKDHEATIYANGKVVVKSRDFDVTRRVWEELLPLLRKALRVSS